MSSCLITLSFHPKNQQFEITRDSPKPMDEFTKLKHYSAINLLSKCHPNTSALGKLHKMVKLDGIIH